MLVAQNSLGPVCPVPLTVRGSKYVLSTEERAEFESLAKAHAARVEALRACRAAPKPKPMASTPLEGDAMMILKAKMMAGK